MYQHKTDDNGETGDLDGRPSQWIEYAVKRIGVQCSLVG